MSWRVWSRSTLPSAKLGVRSYKTSIVDWQPIRSAKSLSQGKPRRSGVVFLTLLVLMPVISFGLGTWQVKRLQWKTDLITKAEAHLALPPLPLPPHLDPEIASKEFDYRRVVARGKLRYDQEMFVGPQVREGVEGYSVITPLERDDGSKLLVFRGWIAKRFVGDRADVVALRRLPEDADGQVELECLLRRKPVKSVFTPDPPKPSDSFESRIFHFEDIDALAERVGAQPIKVQQIFAPVVDAESGTELMVEQMARHGMPIGTPARVDMRNAHMQYIVTWYGLSALTTLMLMRVLRGNSAPAVGAMRRKLEHAQRFQ